MQEMKSLPSQEQTTSELAHWLWFHDPWYLQAHTTSLQLLLCASCQVLVQSLLQAQYLCFQSGSSSMVQRRHTVWPAIELPLAILAVVMLELHEEQTCHVMFSLQTMVTV